MAASEHIMKQAFPNGVKPIINLPFEEQYAHNFSIVKRFKTDLKDDVAEADIQRLADRLAALNSAFRAELDKSDRKEIDFSVLEAAREEGNLNLRKLVALVLTEYREDNQASAEAGEALLRPVLEQVARLRQIRKARRNPQDIDPDTGDEISDETGALTAHPTSGDAPALAAER